METTIKQDRTDHFVLVCGCRGLVNISSVSTQKQGDTKVTYIIGKCIKCGNNAQKKIYWDCTCSSFCE